MIRVINRAAFVFVTQTIGSVLRVLRCDALRVQLQFQHRGSVSRNWQAARLLLVCVL